MSAFTTRDGSEFFYEDWGAGQPVVFSHRWPLDADARDAQMLFLGERGYRVIAEDLQGRSARARHHAGRRVQRRSPRIIESRAQRAAMPSEGAPLTHEELRPS